MVTIKGRVGNAAIVEELTGPANINQDVALVRTNDKLPAWYITAFLNSKFGKMAVERNSTGQINPFLALGNLRRIRVPVFDRDFMIGIGEQAHAYVSDARLAAERAKSILALAKRAVEVAIEQDEAAGFAVLSSFNPQEDE